MIVLKSKEDFSQKLIRKGYSKSGFAKVNGISGTTLIQISNGKQYPRPETAKKICNGLGLDFDELFEIVQINKELSK